jgi:DNA (cytosine-5)-methyltransferase 1
VENVQGILTMRHGQELVPDMMVSLFEKEGYRVEYRLLNAADYGVPQARRRVIFIGSRMGGKIKYPRVTHGTSARGHVAVRDAIDELKDIADNLPWWHVRMRHSKDFLDKIRATKCGDSATGYSEAFWRLIPDEPARTAKANNGSVFIHYDQDRAITPREMATIQSFGYEYRFVGSKHDVLIQICNAVPPLFSKAIAGSVKGMLK